ncbi:MAG: outer membrane beta-barrel protein [Cyclobacteriaceae bacterium]|nr:outer membrane beta-barrel protein [Cyclobacteriaceae bacterium]
MALRNFLIVFLATSSMAYGQEFFLGVKGGLEVFKTRYQDRDLRDYYKPALKGGIKGGGFILFPLPDQYSFIVEGSYSIMGRRVKFNNCEWINKSTYYFIEMPLLLRKTFPLQINTYASGWYVNIGPNIKYWLGGTGSLMSARGSGEYDEKYSINFTDTTSNSIFGPIDPKTGYPTLQMWMVNANRFLFGLDFGVGYTAHIMGNQRFYVEMRYTYGHTYLGGQDSEVEFESLGFTDDLRSAFRVLNFSVGWSRHFDFRDLKKGESTIDKKKRIRR